MDRRLPLIIGGAILVMAAVFAFWNFGTGRGVSGSEPLTEITDPAIIQNTVQLTHLSILTSDTYAGTIRIRNITGILTNISLKPVRRIDLKMTFMDSAGNSVQESTHTTLNPRSAPLEPGSQYRFEVNFENLPESWNYHVPDTQIVKVGY